jgi:hypothetical protein
MLLQTMALSAVRARAVALVARPVVGRAAASQSRGLAGTFEDRERGEESVYFRRTVSLACYANIYMKCMQQTLSRALLLTPYNKLHKCSINLCMGTLPVLLQSPMVPFATLTSCVLTTFATAQEREQLEKLLEKMKNVEDSGKQQLLKILGPHKLPEDVIQKLLDWKQHF